MTYRNARKMAARAGQLSEGRGRGIASFGETASEDITQNTPNTSPGGSLNSEKEQKDVGARPCSPKDQ